jgi:predicted CxxxxCH...CXXCH cytochrome family protein
MKLALIGIAAAAAAALATPALAQAVVEDSGHFAQSCPNANCHSDGPGNSVIERFYREDWQHSPYNPFMDPSLHQRHPTHRG